MFTSYPKYDFNRTLELKSPAMRGEDVFALQKALTAGGYGALEPDGIHGPATDKVVRKAQTERLLLVDGKAGPATQKALALVLAHQTANATKCRYDAIMGQIEWESAGYRLGAYSELRDDGTFDAGITQRNTAHTPAREGFDPELSVTKLGVEVRKHYDLFQGVRSERRRWQLAQGAWNAPAYACYIAKEEGATKVTAGMTKRPSAAARQALEDYMTHVSKYLSEFL